MSQPLVGLNPRDPQFLISQEWTTSRDRYLQCLCQKTHTQISTQASRGVCLICYLFIQQKYTFARKNLRQSKLLDLTPQAITQTHREFVDGLLSECRLKVSALVWCLK